MTRDELVQYLDSEDNEYGLDSVATHGFLCALVVGEPLENWQAVYFDGQQHQAPDAVKQALSLWRADLLEAVQNESTIELPFLWSQNDTDETETGDAKAADDMDFSPESDLSAWSVGFVDAMYGNDIANKDWFANEEVAEDVAMLTLPMMVFSGVDVVYDETGELTAQDDEFAKLRQDHDALVQMANSIEKNLSELYLLFHLQE